MADNQQPIIVKRIKKGGAGAHGGAWKLAYADFVTAMMAFFLLMWLLGSTTKSDLQGIAEHFQQPLKLSFQGGPGVGSSSSVLSGGGTDLTKSIGETARGYKEPRNVTEIKIIPAESSRVPDAGMSVASAGHAISSDSIAKEKEERQKLQDLKAKVEAMIEANPDLRVFKQQLLLDITSEGLRIQIVDDRARPMFDTASAEMKPYTKVIVRAIGHVLNEVDNRISVSGHTDAAQYAGQGRGFSNWELSANRANASRRELIAGGMDEKKIMRVVGLASTIPLDRNDPFAPINRRITLVVMNRRTEQAIMQEGRDLDVNASVPLESQTIIDAARREYGVSRGKAP
jgi:chemotaxis protein MotB